MLSLAQSHRGRPQTTSTRLYAGGELQGSPVWQALAGHKRSLPLAVVLPPQARGPGMTTPPAVPPPHAHTAVTGVGEGQGGLEVPVPPGFCLIAGQSPKEPGETTRITD